MVGASPLSVGDVIALINLLKTIASGLKDQGGAADHFRQIIQELEQSVIVFQYVASLKVSDTYTSQLRGIIGIADGLYQTSVRLHRKIARYIPELGRGAPTGSHRGVVAKTRWVLFVSKEVPKYRASISAQCQSLQFLFSKLLIYIGSQNAVQGRETHMLLENATAAQSAHQMRVEDLLAETQASLATIKRQHEALRDIAVKRVAAVIARPRQRLVEDPASSPNSKLRNNDRHNKFNLREVTEDTSTDHDSFQDLNLTLKGSTLAAGNLSEQNSLSTNRRVSTGHYDDSRDIREIEIDLHNFTDVQLFALYLLIRQGMDFIRNILHVSPQLLLLMGLFQTVPASMSNLLSDNITVLDVLDRKHSLPFEYFQDLGVFKAMLLSKFNKAPGFEKIRDGEFSIVDYTFGDKILDLNEWSQVVRPRAKLVMTIHYSALKLSKRQCVKCGGSMLEVKPHCWECPVCKISFRVPYLKPGPEADVKSLEISRSRSKHLLGHDLRFLKDEQGFASHQRKMLDYRESLLGSSLGLAAELDIQSPNPSLDGSQAMRTKTENAEAEESLADVSEAPEDMTPSLTADTPAEASERPKDFDSSPDEPRRGARILEESQLQYFKRVRIEEESSVYHAALAGDYELVQDILTSSHDADESCGPWGSALTAAIISDSPKVVQLLLEVGYNPLSRDGPLGTTLRASALHGHAQTLQLLIATAQAEKFLNVRSHDLGDALNSALLATALHNRVSAAEILLFHGANPFYNLAGQPSAFLMAVYKKFHRIAEMFLVSAAERELLSQQEFCQSSSTMFASTPIDKLGIHDEGFKKCCTELRENRGRSIQSWILRRLAGAYELAPRSIHAPKPLAAFEYLHYLRQLRRETKEIPSFQPSFHARYDKARAKLPLHREFFAPRKVDPTIVVHQQLEQPSFEQILQKIKATHSDRNKSYRCHSYFSSPSNYRRKTEEAHSLRGSLSHFK